MSVDQLMIDMGSNLTASGFVGPDRPTYGEEVVSITYTKGSESVKLSIWDDDYFVMTTYTRGELRRTRCIEALCDFHLFINNQYNGVSE